MKKLILMLCLITANVIAAPDVVSTKNIAPSDAAIASASKLATEAGLKIIKEGGNAFDAAVTVATVLAVAEPYNSGLGGGGFLLLYRAKDKTYSFIDAREVAPATAAANLYLDSRGNPIDGATLNGPLAAAIPGEVAGMVYLEKNYGKLSLEKTLQPAIDIANKGFNVDKLYQEAAQRRLAALLASPAAAQLFLHDGLVPAVGYVIKQPELAKVLSLIVKEGNAGFYHGPIAKKMVTGVKEAGGIWQLKDLKNYKVIVRKPLIRVYHNAKLIVAPPPSAGGIALITMLNIASGYDFLTEKKVNRAHILTEAMRRAFYDRSQHLGDPNYTNIPTEQLTSDAHAREASKTLSKEKATASVSLGEGHVGEGTHTTHFSILDKEGNRVAATLSLNYSFGSGFVPQGTGVLLNDQMDDFSINLGGENLYGLVGHQSNMVAPGKRPLSSMSPTFVETKDKVAILGTPGGSRIISMVLLAIIDFMDGNRPLSWVTLPRFHHQFMPDEIQYEKDAFNNDQVQALQQKGHKMRMVDNPYGNMQAILWDKKNNKVYAASDPRGNGSAQVLNE